MVSNNGADDADETDARDSDKSSLDSLESNSRTFGSEIDYIRAYDEIDPGAADRILRLIEVQVRDEERQARQLRTLRLLRLAGVVIGVAAIIAVSIYLIVPREKNSPSTDLTTANLPALIP